MKYILGFLAAAVTVVALIMSGHNVPPFWMGLTALFAAMFVAVKVK